MSFITSMRLEFLDGFGLSRPIVQGQNAPGGAVSKMSAFPKISAVRDKIERRIELGE